MHLICFVLVGAVKEGFISFFTPKAMFYVFQLFCSVLAEKNFFLFKYIFCCTLKFQADIVVGTIIERDIVIL